MLTMLDKKISNSIKAPYIFLSLYNKIPKCIRTLLPPGTLSPRGQTK